MQQKSRSVDSNQTGVHDNLEKTVKKHLSHNFLKPIATHSQQAFENVSHKLAALERPLILDSCCGVGDSSRRLAELHPDHWIVGVDKSAKRLAREREQALPENLILVRADLNDFYRLVSEAGWRPERHYILYPNPWPKSVHLKRRWHGSPVFKDIIALGGRLELRSNWKIYLEEFQLALKIAGQDSSLKAFDPDGHFLTPFEKKYHESGQELWQLVKK